MGQRNAIIDWIGNARGSQIRRNVMRNAVSPSLRSESFGNSLFHQSMILGPVSSVVCDGDRDDEGDGDDDVEPGEILEQGGRRYGLAGGKVDRNLGGDYVRVLNC